MLSGNLNERKCRVIVSIHSGQQTTDIPKHLQLITQKGTTIFQKWLTSISEDLGFFSPGLHLLKISLPSGAKQEKVIRLIKGKEVSIRFNFESNDIPQDMEWAFFAKPQSVNLTEKSLGRSITLEPLYSEVRILTRLNDRWTSKNAISANRQMIAIDDKGEVFQLNTVSHVQMLEIRLQEYPPKYVRLPANSSLKILIRRQISSLPLRHPLEVIVSTENWRIEALLQLIKPGSIKIAEDFIGKQNAEDLLREKYVDANAASIGAYYLLRSGAYKKTVGWMRNLANDFPFLPDGPAIYAAQLINKMRPGIKLIEESRKYFLIAAERGLPVYTMGFIILREGLIKMSNHFGSDDQEISVSLKKIEYYHKMIDYTRDVTTLNPVTSPVGGDLLYELYTVGSGSTNSLPTINSWTIRAESTPLLPKQINFQLKEHETSL
jgi:hypothetical protein